MADSFNITEIQNMYREDYLPGLISALQCSVNTLEGTMRVFSLNGKEQQIDAMGMTELDIRTQRMQDKTFDELAFKKRWMKPCALAKSLTLSKDDFNLKGDFPIKMVNLQDELVNAAKRAYTWVGLGVTRDKDKTAGAHTIPGADKKDGAAGINSPYSSNNTYRGGVLGTNVKSEDDGETRVEEEFPLQPVMTATGELASDYFVDYTKAGQIDMEKTNVIPANYVLTGSTSGKSTDLTVTKLRAVREAFETRHAVTDGEMLFGFITPHQASMLYADPKLQKECGWQILKDGLMSELLGIRLITSTFVPKVQIGGKWIRTCPVWHKDAVGFGLWNNAEVSIYELNQRSYDQIGVDFQCSIGACRLIPEAVMTIHCDEEAEAE